MNISMAGRPSSRQRRSILIATRLCIGGCLVGLLAAMQPPAVSAEPSARKAAAIEAGRRHFVRCVACHSVNAAEPAKTGPHLAGIVGRRVASLPGFRYTTALKDHSFVWTKDRLANLLRQPQKLATGLCFPFTGLTRRRDRTDLVAYLERPVP